MVAKSNTLVQHEIKSDVAECDYPWAVQVACTLLHRTTGHIVRSYIHKLFKRWPTPADLANADHTALSDLIKRGGFHHKRATTLKMQAQHFADGKTIDDLPFAGPYAKEAHRIFVLNDLSFVPGDRVLRIWRTKQKVRKNSA